MDLKELEKWINTDEGKKWLDGKKEGLIRKNEELIKELKTAGGGMSELTQRVTDTEKALGKEKAAMREALLLQPLEKTLLEKKVFPVVIPALKNELIEAYGLDVKEADGGSRSAMGVIEQDGAKMEKPLSEIIDLWIQTEDAKSYIPPPVTSVVSTSVLSGVGGSHSQPFDGLSGRELAAMSDRDFDNAVKEKLR
jgi:hypothetical protein